VTDLPLSLQPQLSVSIFLINYQPFDFQTKKQCDN